MSKMMVERYIPAGRTSRIKGGPGLLQIQTEYAYHPYPRITTSIQSEGQVLHKIEKRLEAEIATIEEQQQMEEVMRRQHSEVEEIVRRQQEAQAATSPSPPDDTPQDIALTESEPVPPVEMPSQPKSVREMLREVPGVEHIYRLDNTGEFHGEASGEQFRKTFSAVFKGLQELLMIFDELPGPGPRRRRGIYEVERDRLYLVSMGEECLFVTVNRVDRDTDYEKALKEAAFGIWGPDFIQPEQQPAE